MTKHILIVCALVVLNMVAHQTLHAQNETPKFNRCTVVPELYGLTESQMAAYDRILDFADEELLKMKKEILSKNEKEQKLKDLSSVLKTKVSAVFSNEQYKKWCSAHGGYAPSRFYIEDVGMTVAQFAEFRKYTEDYRLEKVRLNDATMSSTERDELRRAALNLYREKMETIDSME